EDSTMTPERYADLLSVIADEARSLDERHEAIEEAVNSDRLPLQQRVRLMRACLAARHPAVRDLGINALGSHPSTKVREILRGLLEDTSEAIQAAALKQLASHGAPGVYDVCVRWLCHGSPTQRQAAVLVALQ